MMRSPLIEVETSNPHALLQHAISNKAVPLIADLVESGYDLNARDPLSGQTSLEYALEKNNDYEVALTLIEMGAKISPEVFKESPNALIGWQPITLPKVSLVTGKVLSWQDKASLLQAGDLKQKFPDGKIIMGFSSNIPTSIVNMFKEAINEFARHANITVEFTDQKRLANLFILYQPIKGGQQTFVSGHTYPLPPTTSNIDLDDTQHHNIRPNQVKIQINSDLHPLPKTETEALSLKHTITHELGHAILGEMHPQDLDKISFALALQPFIKNSMKALDSPDLTVMSYEDLGYEIKLVHQQENAILQALHAEQAMFNMLGIAEGSIEWKRLDLVERAEYQLGYADTVVAIEKYGLNQSKMNEIVIHPLNENSHNSYTLANQGGVGILDARQIYQPAEFVLDPGFCPTKVVGGVYYNGYLSPMQGLMTGPGEATIYLGHTDHWIAIQGAAKKLIWEPLSEGDDYTSQIFGFRPAVDTLIIQLEEEVLSLQPKTMSVLQITDVIDVEAEKWEELLKNMTELKAPLGGIEIASLDFEGKLKLYDVTFEELTEKDIQFSYQIRDPFTCAGNARGMMGHLEEIPIILEA